MCNGYVIHPKNKLAFPYLYNNLIIRMCVGWLWGMCYLWSGLVRFIIIFNLDIVTHSKNKLVFPYL